MSDNYIGAPPPLPAPVSDATLTARVAALEAKAVALTSAVSASGSTVDILSIPSWAKVIHLLLNGIALSGSNDILIQLGSPGGVENTGYSGQSGYYTNGVAPVLTSDATGLHVALNNASDFLYGQCICTLMPGNTWSMLAILGSLSGAPAYQTVGQRIKTLSQPLDRLRIAGTAGSFTAGSIVALYF